MGVEQRLQRLGRYCRLARNLPAHSMLGHLGGGTQPSLSCRVIVAQDNYVSLTQ